MRLSHAPHRRALIHTSAAEREGGYVLVMFALLLIPLMLFVGFSVDVGSWYNRASDMQKAADAASLAGVVWLPDEAKARSVALATAKKNGFDDADPNIEVTVSQSDTVDNRLIVKIRDRRVGSFIYSNLGGDDLDMSRIAYAEFVKPVPMGSPRNFFGTGHIMSGSSKETLYQSINAYCTDKVQGDRHGVPFTKDCPTYGDLPGSSDQNDEYWADGYKIVVNAPKGRSDAINVRLYDPRFNAAAMAYHPTTFNSCTPSYGSWNGPGYGTSKRVVAGPAQYQTRNSTGSSWGGTVTLGVGQDTAYPNELIRYRYQTAASQNVCVIDGSADALLGGSSNESYSFTMYKPDTTPNDLSNNEVLCAKQTFAPNAAFANYRYLNSRRWVDFCTIPSNAPAGEYIIQVQNGGEKGNNSRASNQYGVVARYSAATGDGLCDGRTDKMCPRVYGLGAISVYAATSDGVASFFLAEIAQEHTGKTLKLELWDPGEGGSSIRIMHPTGSNTWAPRTISWSATGESGGTNVTSIDVTGSKFNGKLLEITVDLTGYSPPEDNNWWKIEYTFSDAKRPNVTDRTTWSARILGDPVHLVEE